MHRCLLPLLLLTGLPSIQAAETSASGALPGISLTNVQQTLAQLATARRLIEAGDLTAARAALTRVAADTNALAHHRWEAGQVLSELTRRAAGQPPRDPAATRIVPPSSPSPGVTLHIAPHGLDTNPGTAAEPLATLERARDAIRALKQRGAWPAGGVAVVIHDGEYPVHQALQLAAQDSGQAGAPVVYRAADGARPRFTGGTRLTGFTTVTDPAILARLPEEARGQVVQLDLKARGLTNLPPVRLGGFASGAGFRSHPVVELFFDGRPMQLARWPNESFLTIQSVTTNEPVTSHGIPGSKLGRFTYDSDRPLRWTQDRDILLYGYWFWDWADSYERVETLDAARREITLAKPFHTYGYRKGQRFYALNLLSEIDQPGEWYLDRATSVLYLYPPSDPARVAVELSLARHPFVELNQVSHLRLEGLTWELGCVDGVIIRGGENVLLAGCVIRRCGGNGVEIQGGLRHGLLSCDIYSLGRGGVTLAGGDRKTLAPGGHFVENCHLFELSRVDHTYTPAVLVAGVGHRLAHNWMHDILSSAIRLGGNDHLVEFNEICHAILESDDQGGVDMWGNATYRGNVFRHNYWHHLGEWRTPRDAPGCGQAGIRFDDAICGQLVYGNIFRRCATGKTGFGAVQIHGGKDNLLDNNLIVDCVTAFSFTPWGEDHWRRFLKERSNLDEIDLALYAARYPGFLPLDAGPNVNYLWRNWVIQCDQLLRRDRGGARLLDNAQSQDLGVFVDAAQGDFTLRESATRSGPPGFAPIPFADIGLYADAWRIALPTARIRAMRQGR